MKNDAMLFMQRSDEITHLRPENSLHRPFVRSDDVDFDVACAQSSCDLEPDKAGPDHDGTARAFGCSDDGAAVIERTQRIDIRLIRAGYGQAHWFCAGCQQQPIIGNLLAASSHDIL
jgi:hypothetical protein